MTEGQEKREGTFRCPVCGHRDSIELARDKDTLITPCSYCDTLLEVSARADESIRFQAQVAEEAKD